MKRHILGAVLLLALLVHPAAHADSTYPDGCTATTAYSSTTGHPCTLPDCNPGDAYSALTGLPCSGAPYLPGCYSAEGFSVTTGAKCDGSSPAQTITSSVVSPAETPRQNQSAMPTEENSQMSDMTALDAARSSAQELISSLPSSHPYRNLKLSAATFDGMQETLSASTATSSDSQQTVDAQALALNAAIAAYDQALREVSNSEVTAKGNSTHGTVDILYPDGTGENIATTGYLESAVQIATAYCEYNDIANLQVIAQ